VEAAGYRDDWRKGWKPHGQSTIVGPDKPCVHCRPWSKPSSPAVACCPCSCSSKFQRPLPHYLPDSIAVAGCSCSSSGVESWVFATIHRLWLPTLLHPRRTHKMITSGLVVLPHSLILSALLAFILFDRMA
jgi:hypothetical protein